MSALTAILPPAKSSVACHYDHSRDPWFKSRYGSPAAEVLKAVPPYLKRAGLKPEEFGDGGAFPELPYPQYPLGMGLKLTAKTKTLPLNVDENGNTRYDSIVRQNENSKKIVYSNYTDLVPIFAKEEEDHEMQIDETTQETKAALEKILNFRLNFPNQSSDYSKFIKYRPSQLQQSTAFNSGGRERIIRMVEMPLDPMEPPKFKHKKVPKGSSSPPVPIMHSPPRPVTVTDQEDWKIPSCISNWKNPKGYTIPLDKRLAADGRGLEEVRVNDSFAELSEALYVAEQKAREAVSVRSKMQMEMMMKEKEKKSIELKFLAEKARSERAIAVANFEEREARAQRDDVREERYRKRKLEAAAEGKIDRDIGERVALGMATTGTGGVVYDQRLFNEEKGMDSGFAAEDAYGVYDGGLFPAQSGMRSLYRPRKGGDEEEQVQKRFKADWAGPRNGPTEMEDPFGLDQFLKEVKTGKKAKS